MTPEELAIERSRLGLERWKTAFFVIATFLSAMSLWQAYEAHTEAKRAADQLHKFNERVFEFDQVTGRLRSELQTIDTLVSRGAARAELVTLGVGYLEKMVDPLSGDQEDRDRACKVARELAEIEKRDFEGSDHILRLHAVYARQETIFNEDAGREPESMCLSEVRNATEQLAIPEEPIPSAPADEDLAETVVVLASYRSQNCHIAVQAAENLEKVFSNVDLDLARSRSEHFAVVYSPVNEGPSLAEFLSQARAEGRAAIQRIAQGEKREFDSENTRFVAEAYDISTRGWERLEDCP